MKKSNKAMATVMAAIVAMNAMMVPTMAEERFVPTEDGSYTTTAVDIYKDAAMSGFSTSANGMFADEAEIEISGEWATLKLFVYNPIASSMLNGAAGGVLVDNKITYEGVEYAGELTSIGYENPDAVVKLYSKTVNMLGIVGGETHTSDVIEFTLPKAVLGELMVLTGTLNFSNYNMTHNYYLDLMYADTAKTTSQTMQISATVPANISTYAVTIPESAAMGNLSTTENTSVNYEVTVDAGTAGKSITIETTDATLTNETGSVTLALTNTFGLDGVATFAESGSITGSLMVMGSDVAKIATDAAQNLTGSITFTITAE
ncbi:hypothetical protein [Chakrabartyella piscis]|uniref:hypothetical protein n=1 Tax=Chakrabartyella piscis TaxID=2918914 RepID=UPI00295839AC|nr:hypothetical protein [Chakrabartyella piscis]